MRARLPSLLAALALLVLAACPQAKARPVRIVVSLHGAAGRPVHGFDVTVGLPAGTTVPHDASTRRISSGAITVLTGAVGGAVDGHFVPSARAPAIRILLASTSPMRDGELAAVLTTVTSVAPPPRGAFEVVRATVAGPDGASVPGATGWVSAVELR